MNKYHFHIGDYRRKTAHLNNEEHGIYRWLIDEYFLTEAPISTDLRMIMRKLRLTSDQKDLLEQILQEFFVLEDDGWYHRHVEQVMALVHAKSQQSKDAVNLRWEKERALRKANGKDTDVIRTHNESNTDVIPNQETKKPRNQQKGTRFAPPTVDEVQTYLTEKNITSFKAETFVTHYEANGWARGKSKMKDWKAACRYWHSQRDDDQPSGPYAPGAI